MQLSCNFLHMLTSVLPKGTDHFIAVVDLSSFVQLCSVVDELHGDAAVGVGRVGLLKAGIDVALDVLLHGGKFIGEPHGNRYLINSRPIGGSNLQKLNLPRRGQGSHCVVLNDAVLGFPSLLVELGKNLKIKVFCEIFKSSRLTFCITSPEADSATVKSFPFAVWISPVSLPAGLLVSRGQEKYALAEWSALEKCALPYLTSVSSPILATQ
jgi:hypothetical protein